MDFQFVTEFDLNSKQFKDITDFVGTQTTSPYLEQARKVKPVQAVKNVFKSSDKTDSKPANAFTSIAAKKEGGETPVESAEIESSERLNEGIEEMSAEDYNDVGELAIEFVDFAIDKLFIFLGRNPEKNSKLAESKKKRLKIVIGKLMQKHEVKLSMEFIAVVIFGSYINAKWASSKKIEDGEKEKVKKKVSDKARPISKSTEGKVVSIAEGKKEAKKEVKKEVKKEFKGMVNM
jgi:hypothetical protein